LAFASGKGRPDVGRICLAHVRQARPKFSLNAGGSRISLSLGDYREISNPTPPFLHVLILRVVIFMAQHLWRKEELFNQ